MTHAIEPFLLEVSESNILKYAASEWGLTARNDTRDDADAPIEHCLCTHKIKDIFYMRNTKNNNGIQVGNCCIKLFRPDLATVTSGLARTKDPNIINKARIEFSFEIGVLNEWEHNFMIDNYRKKKLKPKPSAIYDRLRDKILRAETVSCGNCGVLFTGPEWMTACRKCYTSKKT